MGASDEWARRSDIDRLDRAVEDLRELREADNKGHAAEHRALEARIDGNRDKHELEHKKAAEDAEKKRTTALAQRQQKKDRTWGKVIALAAALTGAVSAWVTVLAYLHSH